MSYLLKGLTAGIFILVVPSGGVAQAIEDAKDTLPDLPSFSIPKSPAQAFVGSTIKDVARPTGGQKLVPALLAGIDSAGRVRQGFALEITPAKLFGDQVVDGDEYADDYAMQNWTWSLATARSSGDSTRTALGLGTRVVLVDNSDVFSRAGLDAKRDALLDATTRCAPDDAVQPRDTLEINQCIRDAAKAFYDGWRAENWNSLAVELAVASGVDLAGQDSTGTIWSGFAAWGTAAVPLTRAGQLLTQVSLNWSKADDQGTDEKVAAIAGRVIMGNARTQGFVEASFQRRLGLDNGSPNASFAEGSLGLEFLATDGVWVSTGLGRRFGDSTSEGDVLFALGLRFSVAEKRQLVGIIPSVRP